MFTDQDLKQISERGISLETVEKQLAEIKKGFPFLKIEDAAAVGKGIMSPDEATRKAYLDKWAEYVGEGHRHKGLSRSCLRIPAKELHWIREDLRMTPGEVRRYRVRIRYRQPLQEATLVMREKALYVLFDQPQRGITPGQFAVWYALDDEMLGSGVI